MIGDIIFVRTENFIGRQIRKVSGGYYNHVGIMISDTEIIEATYKGVKLTNLDKFDKLVEQGKAEYNIASVIDVSEDDIYSAVSFAHCQIGAKYDYIQLMSILFFFLLRINRKVDAIECSKAFICSELVAEAYKTVNVLFHENIHINLITPHDLEVSDRIIFNK
jgi:uncharacterized protein YycO